MNALTRSRYREPSFLPSRFGIQPPSSGTSLFLRGRRSKLKNLQLFEAGDTISHLNSRTPQLLSIVTELQQSFSEISRLVDAVALPEESGAGLRDEGDGVVEAIVEKGMVRLRLLVLAEGMCRPCSRCVLTRDSITRGDSEVL